MLKTLFNIIGFIFIVGSAVERKQKKKKKKKSKFLESEFKKYS